MAPNNPNFERETLSVHDLELDPENPRIGLSPAADINHCIERLAYPDGEHLVALAKDIAASNLGLDPIVAEKRNNERVVRDGNRRLACIKMLHNPNISPETIIAKIRQISVNADYIPDQLECFVSDNESAILEHIARVHTGEGQGEGRKSWTALETSLFMLEHDLRSGNKNAARLIRYAQNEGIADIPPDLPISTISDRFLTRERIEAIGFSDLSAHPPQLNQTPEVVRKRVKKIISDLSSGRGERPQKPYCLRPPGKNVC